MAEPKEYVTEANALNEKAGTKVPMLIATIIGMVIAAVPGAVIPGIVPILGPLALALGACLQSLVTVSLYKMAIRVRKGEKVAPADVLKVQDFLVPGLILGAPAAAVNLLGYLGMVVPILFTVFSLVALVATILFVWAPIEMAVKNGGYMESWMASVNFWKKETVGALIAAILITIFSIIQGLLIFTPGIALVAMLMYYTDKAGHQPFTPSPASPAMAGAAK